MISPFDTHPAIFNRKDGSVLTISRNGVLCKDKTGKVTCDVDFDDVNGLHCSGYLNSNNNYQIIFRGTNWKNLTEVDTDCESRDDCHNIFETKALIAAFLRNKLTADFPANLETLDLPLDYSYLKRKEVRLQNGNLVFGNTSIPIKDIRLIKQFLKEALGFSLFRCVNQKIVNLTRSHTEYAADIFNRN